MSARDVIARSLMDRVTIQIGGSSPMALRQADKTLKALRDMPHPARLALARELAGPGSAVVPKAATDEQHIAGARAYCEITGGSVRGLTVIPSIYSAMLAASEKETP